MVAIMGTSICHMVLGSQSETVEGMCGVVEDGIIPGLFGFEAGQSAVGDIFAWFVKNAVPPEYADAAQRRGVDIHTVLEEEAAKLRPGESGLLALDWWNGNRSILVDADLSGLLVGATLATKAPDIYRALIEATAFGTRVIIDALEANAVAVNGVVACGGLPDHSRLVMQLFADVTGREFRIAASQQTPALGSAMFGAVAAAAHGSIVEAAQHMARLRETIYRPIDAHRATYDELYAEYVRLHDLFGRGPMDVMKRLRSIRDRARSTAAAPSWPGDDG
jgi:Ribulose kinase